MTSKDTPSPASPFNLDQLRIDLDEIDQPAKSPTTLSSPKGINTPATPAVPTTPVNMSEETKPSGKVLGGVKLSYDNHISWFDALDFWSIQRGIEWIYCDDNTSKSKRIVGQDAREMKIANATLMTLLMSQLDEDDLMMIAGMKNAHDVIIELKRKYEDKRPSTTETEITEFYNYKLGIDESIEHAYSQLRNIARKIISNDSNFRATINERAIYTRLLRSLPSDYTTIVDVQMSDKTSSTQDKLADLQEKETRLKEGKSSAHWSNERSRRQSGTRYTARPVHRKGNSHRRGSASSSSSSDGSNKKSKRKHYCQLCRKSGHNTDDCSKLDEARRHVSKSRSRSVSRPGSKDSRDRSSRHPSKDRNASRDRKGKPFSKDRRPRFQSYAANSDSVGQSDDDEPKSKGKGKAYVAESNEKVSSSEDLSEIEDERAGMAYEDLSSIPMSLQQDSSPRSSSSTSRSSSIISTLMRTSLINSFMLILLRILLAVMTIYGSMTMVSSLYSLIQSLFICLPSLSFATDICLVVIMEGLYQLIKSSADRRKVNSDILDKSTDYSEDDEEIAAFSHSQLPDYWIGDTGATSHMTDKLDLFINDPTPNESGNRKVTVGGGQLAIRGRGIAMFRPTNAKLRDVLYVPKLGANLVSVPKFCGSRYKGTFDQRSMTITDSVNPDIVILRAERSRNGGLYKVTEINSDVSETAAAADDSNMLDVEAVGVPNLDPSRAHLQNMELQSSKDQYTLWHNRFGHLGINKIRRLHEVTTLDQAIQVKHGNEVTCDTCIIAKSKKYRNHEYENKVTEVLGLANIDVCGTLPKTYEGYRYFLQIVDAYSNYVTAIPTKSRSEAADELDKWRKASELATNKRLKIARSDNAPELAQVLKKWSDEDGVRADPTAPYTSSQNGKAERAIQNSEQLARAMISEAKLPITFWPYAVQTAAYILNRTAVGPMVNGKPTSPEEIWTGRKPHIDHMRTWGCKCYVHIPDSKRISKLHPRAEEGLFMGYTNTTSQYRVYVVATKRVSIFDAKCVKFREKIPGGSVIGKDSEDSNPGGQTQLPTPTSSPALGTRSQEPVGVDKPSTILPTAEMNEPESTSNEPGSKPAPKAKDPGSNLPVKQKPTFNVIIDKTSKELGIDNVPVYDDKSQSKLVTLVPSQKRSRSSSDAEDQIRRYKATKVFTAITAFVAMMTTDQLHGIKNPVPIPDSYKAAINDPIHGAAWREAIETEINALAANDTWEETRRPLDTNVVTSKWVFTVKYAPNGSVDRYKARLVARGFTQVYGEDYTETFAPTLRVDSLRILLALMALEDMEAEQVDVNNAFTESDLKEAIYMHSPPGMELKNGRVLRLLRSLYGLKQSAREWNRKCDKALKKLGFKQTEADPCVYFRESDDSIVGVYVDDLLILAPRGKNSVIEGIKHDLRKMFKIKELGEVKRILGMQITRIRSKRTVYIDQTAYIEKFLHEFAMEQDRVRPTTVPMNGYEHLHKTTIDDEPGDSQGYAKRVGSMMFAMVYSRPDICFALSKLSQHMSNPGAHHDIAVKQTLRYLRSTSGLRMKYGPTKKDGQEVAKIYCDSDYAADIDSRRSVLGYVAMLGGGAVSWSSKRQKSVSTSTTEAEYMALSSASKQALWMRQFFTDINRMSYIGSNGYTFRICEDNTGAINLVDNAQIHERSKHIDVAAHFIRELVEYSKIKIRYVNTKRMIADGLTKPLTKDSFERFRSMLGLGEFS